jgi:hypothetical protein
MRRKPLRLRGDADHGAYDAVRAFSARWPSPSSLGEAPEAFAGEAMALLCALGMRIGRENDALSALVERVD